MNVPENLLYTKDHEWLRVDGNKGYIGITDFAQHSLGDIVFVELPEVGAELDAEGEIGTIESVKAVSPVFSPISGTVLEVSDTLESNPELLNTEPYDHPICVVELKDVSEIEKLLKPADYAPLCEE